KLESARALLTEVEQLRPQWGRLFLARAEIEELERHPETAIVNLRKAVELGEDGPEAIHRLVTLLEQRKRYDEANSAMSQLRQSQRQNKQMLLLEANLARNRGDVKAALELFGKAGNENSSDWRDQYWLGKTFEAGKAYDKAEEKLRKAVELAPSEPDPRVA